MTLTQGAVSPSDPRCLEPLTSPDEMSGTCPSSSSLKLACVSTPTFIENPEHADTAAS